MTLNPKNLTIVAIGGWIMLLSLIGVGPAQAHSYLVASTPEADSTATTLPESFSVTANEPLLDITNKADGFALRVIDDSGAFYGDGCLSVVGSTLSMGASLGESGNYRLIWQLVSADGHPVSGELLFSWDPVPAVTATPGHSEPPVCGGSGDEAETGASEAETNTKSAETEQTESTESVSRTETESESEPAAFAVGSPIFIIAAGGLSLLAAILVIFLAVRALRALGKDDDSGNAPPS